MTPCRVRYSSGRSLVKQLKKYPFAFIGVNCDEDLDSLKDVIKENDINWRSFWDGPKGTGGPIATKWGIQAWPTIYIIDAKGKIRFKNILGKDIDEALTELLEEMGHEVEIVHEEEDDDVDEDDK